MIRGVMLPILSTLVLFFCASCDSPSKSDARNLPKFNENILRYDVNAPFASLDPTNTEPSGSTNVFPLLYSYLFVPNSDGDFEPDLAVKWTFDPLKLQWTIFIREDAMFHNSQRVTSKDVKYSYEKRMENDFRNISLLVDRISLISDTALCIHLKKDDPLVLEKIWDLEVIPHPESGEIDYYNQPIGSGPFKFKSRKGEKEICLETNYDYYNGRPPLDQVIFFYQPDREKAWTRLLRGKTDIAQEVSPKSYEMIQQYKDRFYFDKYTLEFYSILLYNTHDPLFSDPRVRIALTHAIDREYIVKNILKGFGEIANGPMGVDSPCHNPDVTPLTFNPKKAFALLKQVGWSAIKDNHYLHKGGKPFEFTMLVFKESEVEKKIAQYIRLCLNEIGIKVELQTLDYEELNDRYLSNTAFQAVLTELHGAYRTPEEIKGDWATDQNFTAKAGGFDNPKVTQTIKKVFEEKDPYKQKDLYYKVESLIISLQPGTFLFQKSALDMCNRRINLQFPFSLNQLGLYRLKYASLNEG